MWIKYTYFTLFVLIFSGLTACRTAFEQVRQSNDPDLILEKANEYFVQKEYLKAQTLYELILGRFRGSEKAEELAFNYAYTHYHLRGFTQSAHYFDQFANTFISSDKREEAFFMSAYSHYLQSPNFRLDQASSSTAADKFQLFVNTYPNSERVPQVNDLMDELRTKLEKKEVEQGLLYYDLGNYKSAIQTIENVLKDFPDTDRAEELRFLILKANFEYAENSFYERKKERYESTLEKFTTFMRKYPESGYVADAKTIEAKAKTVLKSL